MLPPYLPCVSTRLGGLTVFSRVAKARAGRLPMCQNCRRRRFFPYGPHSDPQLTARIVPRGVALRPMPRFVGDACTPSTLCFWPHLRGGSSVPFVVKRHHLCPAINPAWLLRRGRGLCLCSAREGDGALELTTPGADSATRPRPATSTSGGYRRILPRLPRESSAARCPRSDDAAILREICGRSIRRSGDGR